MYHDKIMKKVIVVGPFPPPHNGAAKNTLIWAEGIKKNDVPVICIETNVKTGSAHKRSLRYHFDRAYLTFINVASILKSADSSTVVYIVPDGGFGLFYNIAYALSFKCRGVKSVWMHHRNFHNISNGGWLLKIFNRIIGTSGSHIFLTVGMESAFKRYICPKIRSVVIGNAATCDVRINEAGSGRPERDCIQVGFLSNLNYDKGFDIVVEAFKSVSKSSPEVTFAVGGEANDSDASAWLVDLRNSVGEKVNILGHISGDKKQEFYENSDILVFPTTYKLEAQPNVLMEALAAGCSVIATDHACIAETISDSHHDLIKLQARKDMVIELVAKLNEMIAQLSDPLSRRAAINANTEAFRIMKERDTRAYNDLIAAEFTAL
ncbi:glycosyltransferase family 4 protein [Rhodobacter sp. 24-YEA-8]|uniref:glycosyltransferase family 4 protein n=1 Tax=Rhodobacter sp. 24-YEA-8 TaxID=1884310 RepID=UPI00089829E8|nr:glycosyltransferase family 4 protein [Rhodobacter sp. 24-YEA-8]SED90651.1 Glycosyltransferase involved in cell wall bisynthesis [Rhodobacter sp. 24-YEA-8]